MHSVLARISGLLLRALIDLVKFTLRSIALLMGLVVAVGVAWVGYGYTTCNPVTSDEQAFAIAKKFVLEQGMNELYDAGGDASIFDGSVMEVVKGSFYNCDFAPPHHTTFNDFDFPKHPQLKYRIVRFRDCTKHVSAQVAVNAVCGHVSWVRDSFDYMVYREPPRTKPVPPLP